MRETLKNKSCTYRSILVYRPSDEMIEPLRICSFEIAEFASSSSEGREDIVFGGSDEVTAGGDFLAQVSRRDSTGKFKVIIGNLLNWRGNVCFKRGADLALEMAVASLGK